MAWTQTHIATEDIFVARYDALANNGNGAWVALGNSLDPGGISGSGHADNASIVMTSEGPVVAWLENVGGIKNVYARRFQSGNWVALGVGGASGNGLSNSNASIQEFAIAADGTKVSVAWTQPLSGHSQIYARTLLGNNWVAMNGSASGAGLSNSGQSASKPTLAYFDNGQLLVAWQDSASGYNEIYAARYDGTQWLDAGTGSRIGGGISNTQGDARVPKLAAVGNHVSLVWQDDRVAAGKGNSIALYTKRWLVDRFVEELPGDARDRGLTTVVGDPGTHAVALDAAGHPFVAWSDTVSGKSEVYLQVNKLDLATVHYVNDSDDSANAVAANSFATVPGDDANDGLTPSTPKRSLDGVLNDPAHPINPGDVILVDGGTYAGAKLVGASKNGIIIIGATAEPATFELPIQLSNVTGVTLYGLRTKDGIRISGSTNVSVHNNELWEAGIDLVSGNNVRILGNEFFDAKTGVRIVGNNQNSMIVGNRLHAGDTGFWLTRGSVPVAASGLLIHNNQILGTDTGLKLDAAASGQVFDNLFDDTTYGMRLNASLSGSIFGNQISNSITGIHYSAANLLSHNHVHHNFFGLTTDVSSTQDGLGFFGTSLPNRNSHNVVGVTLEDQAVVQGQWILGNNTGISGLGSLIAEDFDHAN